MGGDRRSRRIEAHAEFILAQLEEQPDLTILELREKIRERHGVGFGHVSIGATLGALPSGTSPETKKSDAEFDLRAWPLNVFDLFSANAAAVLDFAAALGQAKSLTDAIELQSRFAGERYSTLLRQTNEIAELMRRSTFGASSPVQLSFRAFIA